LTSGKIKYKNTPLKSLPRQNDRRQGGTRGSSRIQLRALHTTSWPAYWQLGFLEMLCLFEIFVLRGALTAANFKRKGSVHKVDLLHFFAMAFVNLFSFQSFEELHNDVGVLHILGST